MSATELGEDLLAQDYVLKQLSSSLTYPENETGKAYWSQLAGTETSAFNKIWIMPEKAELYEDGTRAFIVSASLKAMTESDYLAIEKNSSVTDSSSDAVRSVILPRINEELNQGRNFASLRQIHHSLLLAMWFKAKFKDSFYKAYFDADKLEGIDLADADSKQKIYDIYVEAFKKGVFNYDRKERDLTGRLVKRHYFSGGAAMKFANSPVVVGRNTIGLEQGFIDKQGATVASAIFAAGEAVGTNISPTKTAGSALEKKIDRYLEEINHRFLDDKRIARATSKLEKIEAAKNERIRKRLIDRYMYHLAKHTFTRDGASFMIRKLGESGISDPQAIEVLLQWLHTAWCREADTALVQLGVSRERLIERYLEVIQNKSLEFYNAGPVAIERLGELGDQGDLTLINALLPWLSDRKTYLAANAALKLLRAGQGKLVDGFVTALATDVFYVWDDMKEFALKRLSEFDDQRVAEAVRLGTLMKEKLLNMRLMPKKIITGKTFVSAKEMVNTGNGYGGDSLNEMEYTKEVDKYGTNPKYSRARKEIDEIKDQLVKLIDSSSMKKDDPWWGASYTEGSDIVVQEKRTPMNGFAMERPTIEVLVEAVAFSKKTRSELLRVNLALIQENIDGSGSEAPKWTVKGNSIFVENDEYKVVVTETLKTEDELNRRNEVQALLNEREELLKVEPTITRWESSPTGGSGDQVFSWPADEDPNPKYGPAQDRIKEIDARLKELSYKSDETTSSSIGGVSMRGVGSSAILSYEGEIVRPEGFDDGVLKGISVVRVEGLRKVPVEALTR